MRLLWDLERIRKGCLISIYKLQSVLPYCWSSKKTKYWGFIICKFGCFDDVSKILFLKSPNVPYCVKWFKLTSVIGNSVSFCVDFFLQSQSGMLQISQTIFRKFTFQFQLTNCILQFMNLFNQPRILKLNFIIRDLKFM